MSYSRLGRTWPGGGSSWYLYHDVDGGLAVWAPSKYPRLSRRDVRHLIELLTKAEADMAEDEWREKPEGELTVLDRLDAAMMAGGPIPPDLLDEINDIDGVGEEHRAGGHEGTLTGCQVCWPNGRLRVKPENLIGGEG